MYVEEFEVEGAFIGTDIPTNVNLFPQVQVLLRDVHNSHIRRKISENKFNEVEKVNATNFHSKKFDHQIQNLLSLRVEGYNFLLRKKINVKNFHSYTHDEKPQPQEILRAIKALDGKKLALKHQNFKENKIKDLKPTKVDLSKIPTSLLEDEEVDEEYKPFLKQTTLINPVSTLSKETFLKHKKRRTSVSKPTKAPSLIQNLFGEYQNVFSNIKLSALHKFSNMQKYKETISNDLVLN